MKEWFSSQELAGLSGLPSTDRNVRSKAQRENWQSRKKRQGKGLEYHICSIPDAAKSALVKSATTSTNVNAELPQNKETESLWNRYRLAPESMKAEAQRRVNAINLVFKLARLDVAKSQACNQAAKEYQTNRATIYRWIKEVKGYEPADYLAVLLPKYTGRTKSAECSEDAWNFFKTDYLRYEGPSIKACYHRLERAAKDNGWVYPSVRTFERWANERIPTSIRVLKREGEGALMQRYPAMQRSVLDLYATEWINGDGYKHNVFVKWPDGSIERPKTWFWQDVHSRKILSYRVDVSENTDQIRLSFGDLIEQFGIPKHITIDNTRAAANKWMTGGVANRYRFKIKQDDPLGIFPLLGIKVHWTSVLNGKGHGQAKPVERAFGVGGIGEYVDKHPAFAGAYTGPNTSEKPENYASTAVPLKTFLEVLNAEIIAWNAMEKRRTEICAGMLSFDQAFNQSYAVAPIQKAKEEQRRLWLLTAEAVSVQRDGTFTLSAGSKTGEGRNRYYSPEVQSYGEKGQKIIVRFDPQRLHEEVYAYTLDNRFIADARCLEAVGFGDTETARTWNRARNQFIKSTKIAAKAEVKMAVADVAAQLPRPELPDSVTSKVVRPLRSAQPIQAPKQNAELVAQADREIEGTLIQLAEKQDFVTLGTDDEKYELWKKLDTQIAAGESISDERLKNFYHNFTSDPAFDALRDFDAYRRQFERAVGQK